MILNKETIDTARQVAQQWTQGVAILRPGGVDTIVLAVIKVDWYNPANNIHHTTIQGRDITRLVEQRLSVAGYSGPNPVLHYIDTSTEEQIWEIPASEQWYWLKIFVR